MSSRATEFRLLTGAAATLALLPRLAHRGQFLDGVTYAAIARNLAEGRGSFWSPFYTATIYPQFHEHPPLALWLESLFFRVLGDRWFVERVYCAVAAIAVAALIAWMWRSAYAGSAAGPARTIAAPDESRPSDWLPILLWVVVPVVSWTIVGNLLETTVAVFDAAAVALVVAGAGAFASRAFLAGTISGACIAGAVLSKGPVGLFPLAAPALAAILPDRRRGALPAFAGQLVAVAAIAALLAAWPPARTSLTQYLTQQVAASLAGEREVSATHLTILGVLFAGVWLPMAIVAAAAVAAGGRPAMTERDRQVAAAFTAIGLAGTLPILASPKQGGHYLMPAVPFLAIGAGALLRSSVAALMASPRSAAWTRRIVTGATAVLLAAAIVAAALPSVERDPELLADLDRIDAAMPRGETVGLCPAANGEWMLHAWFERRWRVSLDASQAPHDWFVKTGPDAPDCPPPRCRERAADAADDLRLMRCTAP